MSKKIYGKYEIEFSAFTYFDTKNPMEYKKAIRDLLRELGCFLIEPSYKTKLMVELDEPPKKKRLIKNE